MLARKESIKEGFKFETKSIVKPKIKGLINKLYLSSNFITP